MICLLLSCVHTQAQQLAFPTAEGFGRFSQGGRGGKAYLINSTSASNGSGGSCNAGGCSGGTITLKDCLEDRFAVGARTCIFRVGGIIDWPCTDFQCNNNGTWPDFLTIAGQTAPGDGIVIKRMELQFRNMHDVIVRHLRVYPGADTPALYYDQHGSIEVLGATEETYNVIIDHSTMAWAPDDTAASGGNVRDITWQWNVIAEGIGTDHGQSKCGIQDTTQSTGGISYHHNYLANSWYRCPNAYGGYLQVVNNVYYNNNAALQVVPTHSFPVKTEFVNNYIRPGPNTQPGEARVQLLGCGYPGVNCTGANSSVTQLSGNIHTFYRPNLTEPESDYLLRTGSPLMAWQTGSLGLGFPVLPSQTTAVQAVTDVLAKAGARVPTIDSVTQRQFTDWTNFTGRGNILAEDTVGGYPVYNSGTPYTDTDSDGISDTWETQHGLNPNNAADGPLIAANGYSNLENFLNELAGDTLSSQTKPDITSNLVAHWPFDQTSGAATDESGNNHTGTLMNGASYTTSGRIGSSVLLDGISQFVQAADAASLDLTGPYTIAAWVYPTSSLTTFKAVVVKNYTYYLYAGSTGHCGAGGVLGGHATGNHACHATTLPANTWTHLAVTSDGATVLLYRNGTQVARAASVPGQPATTGTLQLGASQYGEYFPGRLDDVRLYARALSALDVSALSTFTPPPAPNPPANLRATSTAQ